MHLLMPNNDPVLADHLILLHIFSIYLLEEEGVRGADEVDSEVVEMVVEEGVKVEEVVEERVKGEDSEVQEEVDCVEVVLHSGIEEECQHICMRV